MATDRCCMFQKSGRLVLPDCRVILHPRSFTSDSVQGPKTPVDSTEIGIIICECDRFEYYISIKFRRIQY